MTQKKPAGFGPFLPNLGRYIYIHVIRGEEAKYGELGDGDKMELTIAPVGGSDMRFSVLRSMDPPGIAESAPLGCIAPEHPSPVWDG